MAQKIVEILLIDGTITSILLLWILAVYGYGFMILAFLQKRFSILMSINIESTKALSLLVSLFLGLFFLCFIIAWWHIFFSLLPIVSIILLLGGLIAFILYNKTFIDRDVPTLLGAIFAFSIVAILSTFSDSVGDSVNYHIQIVTWIQESPLVFGLGNLHTRLGFNGLIYNFYALTDVSQIIPSLRSFIGNEIIYFGLLLSALLLFISLIKNRFTPKLYELFLFFSLFPFLFILKGDEFRGLYCEGIGAVLGVTTFAFLLFTLNKTNITYQNKNILFALAFFFALFGTMIKIANFALILAVLLCFIVTYKETIFSKNFLRFYLFITLCSIVFVMPWAIKGIATSGMIAYPANIGYIESLPWAASKQAIQTEICWIMSWARAPGQDCREVLASNAWMVDWFSMKTRYFEWYFKYFVYAFFLASFVAFIARFTYTRIAHSLIMFICIGIGILYWFFAGPDPRFGMVYIVPLLALLYAYIATHILSKQRGWLFFCIMFLISILPMFMLGRNAFILIWAVVFLLFVWGKIQPKTLLSLFVISSLYGVFNLYRHNLYDITERPKIRAIYLEKKLTDSGLLVYLRTDEPNVNTKEYFYEARPMTPYFNSNLAKGTFLGRDMYYIQTQRAGQKELDSSSPPLSKDKQ
ncbi:hypothetical protein Hc94105_1437 [Helicobacter cinaedi]|uniref:LIC_10190 family membrane protein n=1 Tax=Helicobacter cinaedi TaxID=213 RepID=UPI001F3F6EF5|nr:hypothetical protein [Helicobacter cinaedi]BDB67220.1 hypothetical protein Hc94105_1437 [Helicobacter cinaedi]